MKTDARGVSRMVSAAVTGLLAGLATVTAVSISQAGSARASESGGASQSDRIGDDKNKPVEKHCCAGKNKCAGQGGCGATKGKNTCAGKGGCNTKSSCKGHPCVDGDGGA